MSTVYIKNNSQYSFVDTFYRKNNNVCGTISEQEFLSYLSDMAFVYTVVKTVNVTNHIALFTERNFSACDIIRV